VGRHSEDVSFLRIDSIRESREAVF
jgi:hypothetical protein